MRMLRERRDIPSPKFLGFAVAGRVEHGGVIEECHTHHSAIFFVSSDVVLGVFVWIAINVAKKDVSIFARYSDF